MVANEVVVWMLDPERSRSLVRDQQAPRPSGVNDKVVLDQVVSLDSIFNENAMSQLFVDDVVHEGQLVDCMDRDASVVALVDCHILDVRAIDVTCEMVMQWVSPELECLTDVSKLDILELAGHSITSQHDVRSVLICF